MRIAPLTAAYQRPVAVGQRQQARGGPLAEMGRACAALAARGRFHFARWAGRDLTLGQPSWADDKHVETKIRIGPAADYLTICLLVQGSAPVSPAPQSRIEFVGDGDDTYNDTIRFVPPGPVELSPRPTSLTEIVYEYDVSASRGELLTIWWRADSLWMIKGVSVYDSPRPFLEDADPGFFDLSAAAAGAIASAPVVAAIVSGQSLVASDLRRSVAAYGSSLGYVDGGIAYVNPATSAWQNIWGGAAGYDADEPGIWYRPSATWGRTAADPVLSIGINALIDDELSDVALLVKCGAAESGEILVTSEAASWQTTTLTLPAPSSWLAPEESLIQILAKEGDLENGGSLVVLGLYIEETDAGAPA